MAMRHARPQRKIRPTHPTSHVLPRTRHHLRPRIPRALPAGRNRIRQAHHRRPAPARLLHGGRRPLRPPPRNPSRTLLSFYAAPVGDPAIGPTAYPHRHSASEDPIAPLGHHQQDSTHIAFNVLTGGLTWRCLRFEESGFHGAEPTEQRWGFQPSPNGLAIDSYSSRVTFSPTPNWSSQYSIAHIVSPEALYPTENQQRQTASIMYNRPLGAHHDTTTMPGMDMATPATGNWSTTLLWGRTKS